MLSSSLRRAGLCVTAAVVTAAAVTFSATPSGAVTGGEPVPQGSYRFAVQLSDGTAHGCTGTLLTPYWVLTAKDCLTAPAGPVRAQIGRADLTSSPGFERTVGRTVPHASLNLTLARLTVPVAGIAFPTVSTTPVAPDDSLTVLGYGRTATAWIPGRLHRATTVVTAAGPGTLDIVNPDETAPTTCRGDAGGPALRETGGSIEIVGVHSASWQGGCLGETETRRGAVETRTDVAATWISAVTQAEPRTDFTGDGRADVAGIDAADNLRLYTGNGAGQVSGGSAMLGTGGLWDGFHGITAGDFTGDGRADVAGIDAADNLRLYTGNGAGQVSGGTPMWATGGRWAGFHGIAAGDFNGDHKIDIAGIDAGHNLHLYAGDGTGRLVGDTLMGATGGLWAGFKGITAGDFTGDGRTDLAGIDASNNMRLYVGDGAGQVSGGTAMLGTGGLWAGFKGITAGDFTGDGRTDLAGIDASNNLRLYTGDGAGQVSGGTAMLGTGGLWAGFKGITAGDFTGDGRTDLAGIDASNNLRLYTGNGAGQLTGGSAMLGTGGLWAGFQGLA